MDPWHILSLALLLAVLALGAVLVGVMRQVGTLALSSMRVSESPLDGGPELGSPATLQGIDLEHGLLVAFMQPGCVPCEAIMSAFPAVKETHPGLLVAASILGEDDQSEVQALWARLRDSVDIRLPAALAEEWKVPGTPFAVAITPDAVIRGKGVIDHVGKLQQMAEGVVSFGEPDLAALPDAAHGALSGDPYFEPGHSLPETRAST